jgi:mycofactocin precursor
MTGRSGEQRPKRVAVRFVGESEALMDHENEITEAEELDVEDLLVEEVSIDGMCGVY